MDPDYIIKSYNITYIIINYLLYKNKNILKQNSFKTKIFKRKYKYIITLIENMLTQKQF